MSNRNAVRLCVVLALSTLSFAAAGCSRQHTPLQPEVAVEPAPSVALPEPGDALAPPPGTDPGFFPLELGNHWAYRGRIVEEGGLYDGPWSHSERRYRQRNELVCREAIGDRRYVVERVLQIFAGGAEYLQWIRYRQNREGLFEAAIPTGIPPDCGAPTAAGGSARADRGDAVAEGRSFEDQRTQEAFDRARAELLARLDLARALVGGADVSALTRDRHVAPEGLEIGELTRLAYPLHVGASWLIRRDPRFAARVVAHESLELPLGRRAGFKVRIRSELFGPDDRVHFWVSRLGFLQYDFRLVGVITDVDGTAIGEIRIHERRELSNVGLRSPGRSADPHPTPEVAAAE